MTRFERYPAHPEVGAEEEGVVMRTIYKYRLELGRTDIDLPEGAIFRSFGTQEGTLYAWFEIRTESRPSPKGTRTFEIYGTGHAIAPYAQWLGTTHAGAFVWHLYEHEL